MAQTFLSLSGINYSATGKDILHDINLSLEPGHVYGLVGPNGSGKSTLLKIIARQIGATAGNILWDGKATGEWGNREFARHLAYMPQFTPQTDGMTVRELVALGRFPWHGALGRFSDADRAKVDEALERTDLIRFEDRLVDSMSGGERQRAWIAMMLAQDARCILLDEPTSALDLSHQASVLSLVHDLCHERDLTVIVVLHDINLAARYCDHMVALGSGRIIARGKPSEIVRSDMLQEIFGIDMGVFMHPVRQEPVSYLL